MVATSCCIFLLPKSINRPMGRIREFYSNEEEMKEMGDKEKKEGDMTVVVAKEDLNEVSNVESKPDSNESCSVEQKTA